jgi:hypothetical protein
MSFLFDPLAVGTVSTMAGITGGTYPSSITTTGSYSLPTGISSVGNINWNTTGTVTMHDPNLKGTTLEVQGDANFTGGVTIKGKNLAEVLDNIEKRLAILHPNPELEEKWENLRGLREAYVELEREIIEKEKMWAILKK